MVLSAAADFVQQIKIQHPITKEPYEPPSGSTVYFLLGEKPYTRWDGVLSGASALFKIDAQEAELIESGSVQRFYIAQPDGEKLRPYCLTVGRVTRRGQ